MKIEQMASATITGTPEEISLAILRINSPGGSRMIDYPKIPMIQVIREETGMSLLDAKKLAEKILARVTA